jgi:BirA family biotin operon repressor/biotin-[acetyl-CoA-carboxylase] ligase
MVEGEPLGKPLELHSVAPAGVIGRDLHYYPELESTNDVFARLPPDRWDHGSVVITEYQSRGRGRLGRQWVAPRYSSLLLSVALRWLPGSPPAQATMLCALAAADAIAAQRDLQPSIKWPNDLLLGGGKVSGILCRTQRKGDDLFVIAGIGINANFDPRDVSRSAHGATSLRQELGEAVSREQLASHLFEQLDLWYRVLTDDPTALFAAWSRRVSTVGASVTVEDAAGQWQGTAVRVDPDGGLVIITDGGEVRTVYAADVSLRSVGTDFTSG